MTTPSRDDLRRAFWAGIAFVLVGGAILSFGAPPSGMVMAAWIMLLMGTVGIAAVILRLSGWAPQWRWLADDVVDTLAGRVTGA